MYIGIDPGPMTGLGIVDHLGNVLAATNIPLDALHTELELLVINEHYQIVVMEKYKPYRHKLSALMNPKTARGETLQAEGMVISWARRYDIKLVEQYADVLPIALKHAGLTMPSDHSKSHAIAAVAHVSEYLIRQGLIKSALERKLGHS